jgi:hypothetical protein
VDALGAIAASYVEDYRPRAEAERRFYARHASWEALLDTVSFACDMHGRRHSHQRRLARKALAAGRPALALASLRSATSFADLIGAVEGAIGGIPGIGQLMIYDTALRVGAFLGLEPDLVYLHSGTRLGAKALGLCHRRPTLAISELPIKLRDLRPRDVEDMLCIYKLPLQYLRNGTARIGPLFQRSTRSR